MASLEARIRTAAAATPALTALLGSSPFRWYDSILAQGTAFPAVVMQLVSTNDTYVNSGRIPSGFARYQFAIWDTDAERGRQVDAAITTFFTTFDGPARGGAPQCWYGSQIVMRRSTVFAQPEPLKYQRVLDVNIYSTDQ
jgi:hypothetical protein